MTTKPPKPLPSKPLYWLIDKGGHARAFHVREDALLDHQQREQQFRCTTMVHATTRDEAEEIYRRKVGDANASTAHK